MDGPLLRTALNLSGGDRSPLARSWAPAGLPLLPVGRGTDVRVPLRFWIEMRLSTLAHDEEAVGKIEPGDSAALPSEVRVGSGP